MEKYTDLHTHSTASDGTFTPERLAEAAKEAGLASIALTDHDTVEGIDRFMYAGKKFGIETIPGIELAAAYKNTELHIVGLFIDHKSDSLVRSMEYIVWERNERNLKMIKALKRNGMDVTIEELEENAGGAIITRAHYANVLVKKGERNERNLKMIKALKRNGMDVTIEELEENAGGAIITRAHYANVLVKKGYVKNKEEAFSKYISAGKPGYVKRETLTPKKCIETILAAGGIPVLAHATLYGYGYLEIHNLIGELKKYGLMAVETMYSTYNEKQSDEIRKICLSYGLLQSGGSDFHGLNKPDIKLGVGRGNLRIPQLFAEEMKSGLM